MKPSTHRSAAAIAAATVGATTVIAAPAFDAKPVDAQGDLAYCFHEIGTPFEGVFLGARTANTIAAIKDCNRLIDRMFLDINSLQRPGPGGYTQRDYNSDTEVFVTSMDVEAIGPCYKGYWKGDSFGSVEWRGNFAVSSIDSSEVYLCA